jgi:glycosyltransferase involved in cell wall biosynthesis
MCCNVTRTNEKDKKGNGMKTCVLITLLNDERVIQTITSIKYQTIKPDLILIADGGSKILFQNKVKDLIKDYDNFVFKEYKGSIAKTRYYAMIDILSEYDIVAFIDSDEIAPPFWLEKITKDIKEGKADFVGGKTIPWYPEKSKSEKFFNELEERKYQSIVSNSVYHIPMGNSAWSMKVFKKIGNFEYETTKYGLSEDFDINLRAIENGFRGIFNPEIFVTHDQSHLNTFYKVLKSSYFRFVRTGVTYRKHKVSFSNTTSATKKIEIFHPFQLVLLLLKPFAYITAWVEWNKRCKYYAK